MKRMLFTFIIFLQIMRLASPALAFEGSAGAAVDLSSAMVLVNHGLLAQLHPVKALLNVSSRMADSSTPAQSDRKLPLPHTSDTSMLCAPNTEIPRTNIPWSPALAGVLMLALLIAFVLMATCRAGVVVCRIQHLFARAREGICDASVMSLSQVYALSPLI